MRRSASGSDELCLDVRLWPHSVAIADLMRLPFYAISVILHCRETATISPLGSRELGHRLPNCGMIFLPSS